MGITSVRLRDDLHAPLEAAAGRLRRSKGWIINEALEQFLGREARREQMHRETLEGLADVAAGRLVDGEQVHDWIRSWGTEQELPTPRPEDE